MIAAKTEVDEALAEWERRIRDDAEADDEARRAVARTRVALKEKHPKATVGLLDAMVDLETSSEQKRARLAEGLRRSGQGAFDAKVRWLSTLQSLAAANRAEAQLEKWEPREVAS